MYKVTVLENWPGLNPSDRIAGLVFQDSSDLAATKSSPTSMVVAFKIDEPVLKLLGPGQTEWTEHRYTDEEEDWYVTDYHDFEGIIYAVTSHGRLALVDLIPTVKVTLLESESYYDSSTKTMNHFADVETDDDVFVVLIKIAGRNLKEITIL